MYDGDRPRYEGASDEVITDDLSWGSNRRAVHLALGKDLDTTPDGSTKSTKPFAIQGCQKIK